jgi:DNA-binding CsgD family transcriptional regulator
MKDAVLDVDADADTRRLVEELVRQIAAARARRAETARDVLLDLDVGGLRCILMRAETRAARDQLTPRERDITRFVALGRSNKEIASELSISTWTVAGYLRRIFAKLDVSSRAEMVARVVIGDR